MPADRVVTLTAAAAGTTRTTNLTVKAPALSTLALSTPSVQGGRKVTSTLTLTGPAPAGGTRVALSEAHAAACLQYLRGQGPRPEDRL